MLCAWSRACWAGAWGRNKEQHIQREVIYVPALAPDGFIRILTHPGQSQKPGDFSENLQFYNLIHIFP